MEKRYEAQICEPSIQELWQAHEIYDPKQYTGPSFTIDTPPPTVSGHLHIGHIFSYTQTDIIARYKRMCGFVVFYPFGFDDNGLPTERYVEKARDVKAHEMSRSDFIALCLEESKKAREQFIALWQRMGLSVDWRYTYSTISPSSRKLSQQSFIELYKKGFIYRQDEPALYCTNCRTSVAQAELDDQEMPSFFNDIVFKDHQNNDLLIGTTRPELLPSCVAIFFHPDDERYQHLKNSHATVPLFNHQVPIIPDELVDPEKGTGLVMCCTFGDKTDVEWYKKHKLPYKQSIGFDGKFSQETGVLAGLRPKAARSKIIEELIKHNLLLRQKEVTHSVNVHERCKKEIEYVVLRQWFVNILDHKKEFIRLGDQINWFPQFMKTRYRDWVEHIGWNWCISRQRFYGIPFPVWYCACGQLLLPQIDQLPVDPQEQSYPGGPCTACGSNNITPDTDVMDTWNTSSISPYLCFNLWNPEANPFDSNENKTFLPMAMRPQAHDIIRTWAFYTIVKGWMHNKTIPWNEIVISGHVLSGAKEKLSKSKGNNPLAPENLLQNYPADAVRYWTASGSLGHDISFSEDQLKIGMRLVTKLWNAFRFAEPHLTDFTPTQAPTRLGIVDEWLLEQLSRCFERMQQSLNNNEFGHALDIIEQFFWHDFCDNYLELIKHQLFNASDYNEHVIYGTKWTLYHAGMRVLQLYAPYVPFVTESIYQALFKQTVGLPSLHQTQFKKWQTSFVFKESSKTATQLLEIVSGIRKLKTEQQLSLKTPINKLTIYSSSPSLLSTLQEQELLIRGVSQAEEIVFKEGTHKPTIKELHGLWYLDIPAPE